MTKVPDQIALRRHRGSKICSLAMMVGASILFVFGASDIRSLTQAPPAAAKSRNSAPQDRGQTPAQPAPYDHDLQRLSEILGALHFLRGICNSNEGQKWRNEALALIDAGTPSGSRHDEMVASFNRGYSAPFGRAIAPVPQPPTWSSAAISRKAQTSLATLPRDTRAIEGPRGDRLENAEQTDVWKTGIGR